MEKNVSVNAGGGMSLCTVLTIIFVVLKLVGVIEWSWVWVLAPLWIGFGLFLVVLIIMLVILAIGSAAIKSHHRSFRSNTGWRRFR
jgi:membrane protein YdbS with pleckstrin-like domain